MPSGLPLPALSSYPSAHTMPHLGWAELSADAELSDCQVVKEHRGINRAPFNDCQFSPNSANVSSEIANRLKTQPVRPLRIKSETCDFHRLFHSRRKSETGFCE